MHTKRLKDAAPEVDAFAAGAYARDFPNYHRAQQNLEEAMEHLEPAPPGFGHSRSQFGTYARLATNSIEPLQPSVDSGTDVNSDATGASCLFPDQDVQRTSADLWQLRVICGCGVRYERFQMSLSGPHPEMSISTARGRLCASCGESASVALIAVAQLSGL